ncbi:phosphate ABC transporter permease PstA [Candidatus Bathyarchaeota archaeon]|nr:phosphate ABC transporter permease PstA [Candidatus Bathyarchaeota archaeon]
MNEIRKEQIIRALLYVSVGLSVVILPVIVVWVASNGLGAINLEFLTGRPYRFEYGGIFPQIVGSIYLVSLCTLFGAPLGIASAIYLSEYAPDNLLTQSVRFFTETLAGMPSIVIGLFGLEFLVFYLQLKTSLIAGALSLSLMMLPWTIRASEEAIKVVPREYREASLAMGATKWQTILKVVLPAALPGIVTGVLLGVGKAIGETAVVWLTAGSGLEAFVPRSLSSPTGSLPMYIYLLATQGHTAEGMQRAFGASLVLLVMFLTISVSALLIRNHYLRKLGS